MDKGSLVAACFIAMIHTYHLWVIHTSSRYRRKKGSDESKERKRLFCNWEW